jgi:hypothetical protein
MRTTIYINHVNLVKLEKASSVLNMSMNQLISIFITRLTKDDSFYSRLFQSVKYQDSDSDMSWKIKHIEFEEVFYEKALDLRRNYKFSVSRLIAYAVDNYLDDIIEKMLNPENKDKIEDNYDRDYSYKAQKIGKMRIFKMIWNFSEKNT